MKDLARITRELHNHFKFKYESRLTDDDKIEWTAELVREDFLNGAARSGVKTGIADDQYQALVDAVNSVMTKKKKTPWWKRMWQ